MHPQTSRLPPRPTPAAIVHTHPSIVDMDIDPYAAISGQLSRPGDPRQLAEGLGKSQPSVHTTLCVFTDSHVLRLGEVK